MTTPTNYPVGFWHRERGDIIKICGRFQVTAPNITGQVGEGFTATRTALGDYLITFTGAAAQLLSAKANCQLAVAATDRYAQIGAFTPGGAGAATLQIRTKLVGANNEVANGDWVHFEATIYGECLAT